MFNEPWLPVQSLVAAAPSIEGHGERDPSIFRAPARTITSSLSEPPTLSRGKKNATSGDGEMSPPEHPPAGETPKAGGYVRGMRKMMTSILAPFCVQLDEDKRDESRTCSV